MRVVLDTNVFVSAILGGKLGVILDEWRADQFTLLVSEAIVREYLDVIHRPKFKFSLAETATITEYLLKTAEFVTPMEKINVVEADPSDNKFLETAVAGKAIYVVSGDHHLLQLETFREIKIIKAHEFIALLQTS
ncbi:MAG: putative toxin-antitoxin system toxin component, PIN family [Anaerolineaceae bacterium]|nr:putative toxin-antitoxin system toxin component, PIN family [Anaerolineaceae bacterium]